MDNLKREHFLSHTIDQQPGPSTGPRFIRHIFVGQLGPSSTTQKTRVASMIRGSQKHENEGPWSFFGRRAISNRSTVAKDLLSSQASPTTSGGRVGWSSRLHVRQALTPDGEKGDKKGRSGNRCALFVVVGQSLAVQAGGNGKLMKWRLEEATRAALFIWCSHLLLVAHHPLDAH